jgi:GT2 family glycosyltransferase
VASVVPIAVIIPTFDRGSRVLLTLRTIAACNPMPAEIWVHIDVADGALENELSAQFPDVAVLTSQTRIGPGGGRDRCLRACKSTYAVSFDDDSYPVDTDFFQRTMDIFSALPRAAVIGASIWHRDEAVIPRSGKLTRSPSFTGCGHAIRLDAYRQVRGYIPRPVAYGIEEMDLSLQLFAAGWEIYETGDLRVFHDTKLAHHQAPEVVSATIANVGLFAFLNYPVIGWGWGLLQLASSAVFCLRMGRFRGLAGGLTRIPADCIQYRKYRQPIAWSIVRKFLRFRRDNRDDVSSKVLQNDESF